jgi:hypothetical protein
LCHAWLPFSSHDRRKRVGHTPDQLSFVVVDGSQNDYHHRVRD